VELNIPTIIFEIINFLVLSVLLYHFLFRRVLERVRARAEEKERLMQELESEREQAEQIRAELETRLEYAGSEIDEMISEARERLNEEHKKTLQGARKEANRILSEARSEGEQIKQNAMRDFESQILDTVFQLSEGIVERITPRETHDQLVEEINERIWDLGADEMDVVETIRRSLGERSPTANVETAHKLKPTQQKQLMRTLSALIDRDVELEIEKKPELIAGIRLRVGDTVIDNSVAAQLKNIRSETEESFSDGDLND